MLFSSGARGIQRLKEAQSTTPMPKNLCRYSRNLTKPKAQTGEQSGFAQVLVIWGEIESESYALLLWKLTAMDHERRLERRGVVDTSKPSNERTWDISYASSELYQSDLLAKTCGLYMKQIEFGGMHIRDRDGLSLAVHLTDMVGSASFSTRIPSQRKEN